MYLRSIFQSGIAIDLRGVREVPTWPYYGDANCLLTRVLQSNRLVQLFADQGLSVIFLRAKTAENFCVER